MLKEVALALGFSEEQWKNYFCLQPGQPSPHFRLIRQGEVIPVGCEHWFYGRWDEDFSSAPGSLMDGDERHYLRQIRIEPCPGSACPACPKGSVK